MDMGVGVNVILKSEYECRYNSISPEPVPLSFASLASLTDGVLVKSLSGKKEILQTGLENRSSSCPRHLISLEDSLSFIRCLHIVFLFLLFAFFRAPWGV